MRFCIQLTLWLAAASIVAMSPTNDVSASQKLTSCRFPKEFKFSVATSAYQVEGGAEADGRGPSIWDTFSLEGRANNDTGDTACDSYHQWRRDIEMLRELGVQQYRFSISWSRVMPTGRRDSLNERGVQYYRDLIDGILDAGIEPVVTIFHWDLPQTLQDQGGFLNPLIADYFAEYAQFLFATFGDSVKTWITFNEPIVFTLIGHVGESFDFAPGPFTKQTSWVFYLAGHNLLRAHAKAVTIYRKQFQPRQRGEIGIVQVIGDFYPLNPNSDADRAAAANMREFFQGIYLHPILKGDYPVVVKERVAKVSRQQRRVTSRLPQFTKEEMEELKGSADFIGVNYYFSWTVRALHPNETDVFKSDSLKIDIGGKIDEWLTYDPNGLQTSLLRLKQDYGNIPIYITENGVPDDESDADPMVDNYRVRFLRDHMHAMLKAMEAGVDVRGYTAWSLMDNFEWSAGYKSKYGLYAVNFADPQRKRVLKKSGKWYKNVVKTRILDVHDKYNAKL